MYYIIESFNGKFYIQKEVIKKNILGKRRVEYAFIDLFCNTLPNKLGYGVLECNSLVEANEFIANHFKVSRHTAKLYDN